MMLSRTWPSAAWRIAVDSLAVRAAMAHDVHHALDDAPVGRSRLKIHDARNPTHGLTLPRLDGPGCHSRGPRPTLARKRAICSFRT